MPWCPNCKSEFSDGITKCPDCNSSLVDKLEDTVIIPLVQFMEETEASRFVDFVKYSGIETISYETAEHNLGFNIRGREEDSRQIFNLFNGFRMGEQEIEEESGEEEEDTPKKEAAFVKKRDQYSDVSSTGVMLIVVGIFGLIYALLNIFGILHVLSGIVPEILNIVIFAAALVYGIYSLHNAKTLKEEADKEEQLANEIRNWMKKHITKETIEAIPVEPGLPEELAYIEQTEALQKQVLKQFETNDIGLVEDLVEEYYQFVTEKKLYEE